jgi:hypothetical protein
MTTHRRFLQRAVATLADAALPHFVWWELAGKIRA